MELDINWIESMPKHYITTQYLSMNRMQKQESQKLNIY